MTLSPGVPEGEGDIPDNSSECMYESVSSR